MDRGGEGRRDGRASAVARLDPPVARVAAPLERERPVKTPKMDARFKALGAERLRDPEYQRYVQAFRSHDSLSEAGKVGYRVTGDRHGWEFVHDKIAATRRDNPSYAEQRMIGLLTEIGERDGRGGGLPGHVYEREYKVAPLTHVGFAWPESGRIIEVYGGVHLIPELDPDGTRAAYDAARIERIEGLGWEVLVVTSGDLTTAHRGEAAAAISEFLQDTPQGRVDFSPADRATLDAIFASPDRDGQDRALAAAGYERDDRAAALAEARAAAERARAAARDAHRRNDPDTPDREDEVDAAERTLQTLLESEARAHEGTALRFDALAGQLAERENLAVRERYAAADMALLERLERDKPAFVATVTADLLRRRGAPSVESLAPEDRAQLRADLAEEMGVRQEAAHFIALDMTELQSLEHTYQELAPDRGNGPVALADASAARDAASLSRETAAFKRDEARWAAQRGGPADEREVASFLRGAEEWDRTAARFEDLERQLAPRPVDAGEARMLEDAYHGLAEERGRDMAGPLNAYMATRGADMSRETAMDYRMAAAFEVRQEMPGQLLDEIGREAVTHWRAEADRYDAQAVRFETLAAQLDQRATGVRAPGYPDAGGVSPLSLAAPPDVF